MDNGTDKIYAPEEILHIPGLGFDGLEGKSVIRMAREAIGLGLAVEEFGSRFFSNGAHPSGIVEYPEGLKDDARKRLKEDLKNKFGGLGKSHNLMVFEHGMQYHQVSVPPDDAQFLESRKFQVHEIARIYRVPLYLLAELEHGASYNSVEMQSIDFVIHTVRPWLVRIEQVLNDKLISSKNNKNYIEFVVEGLLRGDSKSRAEFYNKMFQVGAMSPNDIREKENMNPTKGGDQRFVPLNFIPLEASNPKLDDGNAKSRTIEYRELRARRSASKRVNIRGRYKRLVKNAAETLINKEVKAIRELIKKELRSEGNFKDEIVKFYEQFPEEVIKELEPVLNSLAESIAEEASDEINLEEYSVQDFIKKYMENLGGSHTSYSQAQILALVNESIEKDTDAVELVEERMDEWEEKRPDKIAEREAVKLEGAITRTIFAAGGITKLIWVANSDACPICSEMDGKIVGIEESFMEPKDSIGDFSPGGSITHPPLHEGCSCSIAAY